MKSNVTFTNKEHWNFFSEFCEYEIASGGPDPQIPLVGNMSKGSNKMEMLWRGGCYICVYNVPFAEVLWMNWSLKDIQANKKDLLPWIEQHWDGIKTRVERKSVRIKKNMETFLLDYATYIQSDEFHALFESNEDPEVLYDKMFYDCQKHVKFLGRYVAIKLIEYYRTFCGLRVVTPDIRPIGAWSPRTTLSVLWPKYAELLMGADKPENIKAVNSVVNKTIKLFNDADIEIDKFQLQVMLCEYRESYESMRQYPGRSHDSELGYWDKAASYWGPSYYDKSLMLKTRKAIFPNQHLGELNGWSGGRKECGAVLAKYKYTWSDLLYNFKKSCENMEYPIEQ